MGCLCGLGRCGVRIVGEEHAAVVGVEVEVGHAVRCGATTGISLGRSHLS